MLKKVSDKQKKEISELFVKGSSIKDISNIYQFSVQTITRQLKISLGDNEFKRIKNLLKSNLGNRKNKTNDKNKISFENKDLSKDSNNSKILDENITSSNFDPIDSFFEIAPMDYEINNLSRKELSSISLSEVDFPRVVYMIVDKKIELEIKLLKDFPEWEFLPYEDMNRKSIEIFFDLNLAKRSCNKDQKVLKVPNTDVFRIAAPVLLKKGISRIVCPETLIAL